VAFAELTPRRPVSRAGKPSPTREPWRERHRVALTAALCALPLYFVWWAVFATGGGDLAAQVAWAEFAKMYPDSAVNLFWYGGELQRALAVSDGGVRRRPGHAGLGALGLLAGR
jgi:hypothetical protein